MEINNISFPDPRETQKKISFLKLPQQLQRRRRLKKWTKEADYPTNPSKASSSNEVKSCQNLLPSDNHSCKVIKKNNRLIRLKLNDHCELNTLTHCFQRSFLHTSISKSNDNLFKSF